MDRPEPQAWKRQRLLELGYGIQPGLRLVPVDFEAGESWLEKLAASGFDARQPAVVASTGVSMYLTRDATLATLRQIASLAPGTTLAMTFILTLDLIDEAERTQHQLVYERARAAGTPFISFYRPSELLELARDAGFRSARHIFPRGPHPALFRGPRRRPRALERRGVSPRHDLSGSGDNRLKG